MSAKVEDELAVARRKWQNKISERDRCMREEGGGISASLCNSLLRLFWQICYSNLTMQIKVICSHELDRSLARPFGPSAWRKFTWQKVSEEEEAFSSVGDASLWLAAKAQVQFVIPESD